MPLAEEEIVAEKHTRDIGEIRVHKRVVVKQKSGDRHKEAAAPKKRKPVKQKVARLPKSKAKAKRRSLTR